MRRMGRFEKTTCKFCQIVEFKKKNSNKKKKAGATRQPRSSQQPCSSASNPDSELTDCLVVVPLLTTDSVTLEKEGKSRQLLRAEKSGPLETPSFRLYNTDAGQSASRFRSPKSSITFCNLARDSKLGLFVAAAAD